MMVRHDFAMRERTLGAARAPPDCTALSLHGMTKLLLLAMSGVPITENMLAAWVLQKAPLGFCPTCDHVVQIQQAAGLKVQMPAAVESPGKIWFT